jgi:CHRD domain-containing protein
MNGRTGRRLLTAVLAAMTAVLMLAATVAAHGDKGDRGDRDGKRHHHGKLLTANLSGAKEVPGPGDEDGKGKAAIKVKPSSGTLCFALKWRDIADPTAAHIHKAPKGEAGDVVVPLFEGEADRFGCVENLDEALLRDIKRNPREYYVNIHNAEFEDGAIRGQLKKSGFHRGWFKGKRSGDERGEVKGDRESSDDHDGKCRGKGHDHDDDK